MHFFFFFNYGRTLEPLNGDHHQSGVFTPATFSLSTAATSSQSLLQVCRSSTWQSQKSSTDAGRQRRSVGAEGTRRLQICKPLLWTRFFFFPTRPLRTNKRLVDTEESSERATAEGEIAVWHEVKCLGLVILSDFLFFMEKRRRDKTNGMSQKCQEAIKTKRPRPQTELSAATANSVCLSVSSHGRVAALSDRKTATQASDESGCRQFEVWVRQRRKVFKRLLVLLPGELK